MKTITGDPTTTVAVLFTQTEINHAVTLLDTLVNGSGSYTMTRDAYVLSIYRKLLERFERVE